MNPADDSTSFAVRRRDISDATVVTVSGEIDTDEAALLRTGAAAAVEAASAKARGGSRKPMVVLDLSDVQFIGSVGLSTLLYVRRLADRLDVELRGVTGVANRAVTRPLKLTGVGAGTAWYATLDDAMPDSRV